MRYLIIISFALAIQNTTLASLVTNEDIRDAILSVVQMIRSSEDKLLRHEYREKALGEQLKKGLTIIHKRQRVFDPLKATLNRLEERLGNVEAILIQKDERERIQMTKTFDVIDQINNTLPQMFEVLKNDIITSKEIEDKIRDGAKNAIKNIEGQFLKLKEECGKNNKLQEKVTESLENVQGHINSSEHVLEKYNKKLAQNEDLSSKLQSQNELMGKSIQQVLEGQKGSVEKILIQLKTVANGLQKLPAITDLQTIKNLTQKSFDEIKKEISTQTVENSRLIKEGVKNVNNTFDKNREKLEKYIVEITIKAKTNEKTLGEVKNKIETLEKLQKSNGEQISSELKTVLNKLEKLPVTTDLKLLHNGTLKALNGIKEDTKKDMNIINENLKHLNRTSVKNKQELSDSVFKIHEMINTSLISDINKLKNDIEGLHQLEQSEKILSEIKAVSSKMQKLSEIADMESISDITQNYLKAIEKLMTNSFKALTNKLEALYKTEEANQVTQKILEQIKEESQNELKNTLETLSKMEEVSKTQLQDFKEENHQGLKELKSMLEGLNRKEDETNAETQKTLKEIKEESQSVSNELNHKLEVLENLEKYNIVEIQGVSNKMQKLSEIADMESISHITQNSLSDIKALTKDTFKELKKELEAIKILEQSNGGQILSQVKTITEKLEKVPEFSYLEATNNTTQKSLEEIKQENQNGFKELQNKLRALEKLEKINDEIKNLPKKLQKLAELADLESITVITQNTLNNIKTLNEVGFKELTNKLRAFEKVETINDEQILSEIKNLPTKLQTLAKVGDLESISDITQKSLNDIKTLNRDGFKEFKKELLKLTTIQTNGEETLTEIKTVSNNLLSKISKEFLDEINAHAANGYQLLNEKFADMKISAKENAEDIKNILDLGEKTNAELKQWILELGKTVKTSEDSLKLCNNEELQKLDQTQKTNKEEILAEIKIFSKKIERLPQLSDMANSTKDILGSTSEIIGDLTLFRDSSEKIIENLKKNMQETAETSKTNDDHLANTLQYILNQIDGLGTIFEVVMQKITEEEPTSSEIKTLTDKIAHNFEATQLLENNILNTITYNTELLTNSQNTSEQNAEELKKSLSNTEEEITRSLKQLNLNLAALGRLEKANNQQVLFDLKVASDKMDKIPEQSELENLKNLVSESLTGMKRDIIYHAEQIFMKLQGSSDNNQEELKESVLRAVEIVTDSLDEVKKERNLLEMVKRLEEILTEIKAVSGKFEQNPNGNQQCSNLDCVNVTETIANLSNSFAQLKREIENNQLTSIKTNLEAILADVNKAISDKFQTYPENAQNNTTSTNTLESLSDIKNQIIYQSAQIISAMDKETKKLENHSDKTKEELKKSVSQVEEMTEIMTGSIIGSFEQLTEEMKTLGSINNLMTQTADSVLDTKRRIEYGVQQISLKVDNSNRVQSKELNGTINKRLDKLEAAISGAKTGGLSEECSKITVEIDQVWRQISIMHQKMAANTNVMEIIRNQTDSFVNGSLSTMDSINGNVQQVTSRMFEVDNNLNYLLGRLSLLTQEFNSIKASLGQTLDEIKGKIQAAKPALPNTNPPGTHRITFNEPEEDEYYYRRV